jgi:hypothetical protein
VPLDPNNPNAERIAKADAKRAQKAVKRAKSSK